MPVRTNSDMEGLQLQKPPSRCLHPLSPQKVISLAQMQAWVRAPIYIFIAFGLSDCRWHALPAGGCSETNAIEAVQFRPRLSRLRTCHLEARSYVPNGFRLKPGAASLVREPEATLEPKRAPADGIVGSVGFGAVLQSIFRSRTSVHFSNPDAVQKCTLRG